METPKNYTEGLNLNILFGNLSIRVSTLVKTQPDPGWHVYPHSHFDYEFHIIPRGKGIIRIQGSEFTVTGGEFYITGPQIIHEQISDAQDPMEEYCLECEIMAVDGIPDAYALPLQQERLLTDILSQPYSRPFRDTAGIAGRFEALFREVEEEPAGFFLKLQILIADIVTELFRMVVSSQGIRCACGAPVKSVDAFRAERLVRFVEENYQRDISLADAAGILFLSPRQINRLMKKELSCTFHDYLLRYRLAVAVRLLKEGSLSIEAAAYRAGFSSHYYMYQVFRHFGMETPGQIQLGQNR